MKLLEFAIPTWKRPSQLRTSVCSIVEQGADVVISHHLCDLETRAVVSDLLRDYPSKVRAVACELGTAPDYSDSFKQLFSLPQAEYTWTWGDDDVLVPNAISVIMPLLERGEFDFIHVSEAVRSANTGALLKGKLIDLCNNIGWIDMTGFISCNIIRTTKLNEACTLKAWPIYAKNAFVHCCALLEVLYDCDSAFYDMALVDSRLIHDEAATGARWTEGNVGLRYHYVDEALLDMKARGVIKQALPPKFFRYHSYHLWDRFLTHIVTDYTQSQDFVLTDYLDDLLTRCIHLASLMDPLNRKRYTEEIAEIRQSIIEHQVALQYAISKAAVMNKLVEDHGRERYDLSYLASSSLKSLQPVTP